MGIGTGTAALIGGVAAGAGGVASAAIGANAAGNAASAQSNAAMNAAQLQHQDAQAALNVNQQQYAQNQANLAPFLKGGTAAYANLLSLMGTLPPSQMGQQLGGAIGPPQTASKLMGANGVDGLPAGSTVSQFTPGLTPDINGRSDFAAGDGESRLRSPLMSRNLVGDSPLDPSFSGDSSSNFGLDTGAATSGGPTPIDLNSQVNPALGAPGSLAQGWQGGQFVAPNNVTEQNDPGFQFRLQQGQKAIEQSAAARGGLLSGGTAKALDDYSQGQASNEYGNVYSRALGQYQQNYNQFEQQSTDKYNRLAALAGIGPQTAQQLGTLGNQSAGNAANILLTSGGQIGQDLNNAGAATASGYIGGANAWGNALGGLGNTASSLGLLSLLGKSGSSGGGIAPGWDITF